MGFLDAFRSYRDAAHFEAAIETAAQFAVDGEAIPPGFYGLSSYASPVAPSPRVDRRSAEQVPAIASARRLIAETIGTLPLDYISPQKASATWPLFEQPEADVPRSITMTNTVADLMFDGVAWWLVKATDWRGPDGYPTKVERLDTWRVSVDEDRGKVYVDGREARPGELIRFYSPHKALLVAGARAIRACLQLDAAALRYAEGAPPQDYFTPAAGLQNPASDDTVTAWLNDWTRSVQNRATGFVPAGLEHRVVGWDPQKLQLHEARQHAVLEIARLTGIDPEELGVSTTSRTYANQFDRRKAYVDFTLGPFISAIQDRLSMGDVSQRGYVARFNLDAFLRSDTKTRFETYEIGLRVGAIGKDEVRALEDKPALGPTQTVTPTQEVPVAASSTSAATFDGGPALRLDAPGAQTFEVDVEKRTIKGLAVPYGKAALSKGQLFQFSKGSLRFADVSRVKLWVRHNPEFAVGVATELDDRDDGLYPTFKVARGKAGDEALQLAEDGVLDGLSIGLGVGGRFSLKDGVQHAVEVPLMEISLTPAPSFDDARVHAVAASATHEEKHMETETTGAEKVDFSSLADALSEGITKGFQGLTNPQAREVIDPAGPVEVKEPSPYRFDGVRGEHSFTADMLAAHQGDSEARQRLSEFGDEFGKFAVTTTNVGSLNPTQNRPDLFVPNLTYSRPLWESVSTGTINDKTPFTVPKFSSASGLVGAHTEGTEPTPGAFAATVQTVAPTATSGKIEINREVLDQGGSPQADQIIWNEMLNGWYEAIEARIATTLAAIATAELNLASAVDNALVNALTGYFAGLQFVRGGNRFTGFVSDGNLFAALVAAKDSAGRPLLPILGPTNAQGTTGGGFDRVQLGNQAIRAAWALGTGNDKKSYNFVPSSVWAWASAPKKFVFEYQVKSVDMAIWGYTAAAVLRDSDVKPIDYTTADS